jgi:DNA-binding transcriptional LysR family regulator
MAAFVAVADAKGCRAAGIRLGLSHTAVSQTGRRLEERLGVAQVQRTTRSVRLTAAGKRLYAAVRPAVDELRAAAPAVGEMGEARRGATRLLVSTSAPGRQVAARSPTACSPCRQPSRRSYALRVMW